MEDSKASLLKQVVIDTLIQKKELENQLNEQNSVSERNWKWYQEAEKKVQDLMKRDTKIIELNRHEIQSGLDRQRHAEMLIEQLPNDHDGRNTWLLNYGVREEAVKLRNTRSIKFDELTQSAETIKS